MGDLAGHIVGAKWQIVSRIGEGTFGDVWVARHCITGRQKALKLLHPSYSSSAEATERFVREAQAAARIDSPHVVGVDDIGHDENLRRAYLVMELLRGESLYDYLIRPPYRMASGEAIVVLRQVAAALDAAHGAGIVHRDLKPENVFLSWRADGSVLVKVLDFGMAKLAIGFSPPAATLEGMGLRRARTVGFVGTVGYASPEQVRDAASVGTAADVFALGVCAFEMLTGTSYWQSERHEDLVAEILEGITVPPSRRAPPGVTLAPGFDAWMARACARDPAARFDTAGEAVVALEDALDVRDPLPSPRPRSAVPQLAETTGRVRLGTPPPIADEILRAAIESQRVMPVRSEARPPSQNAQLSVAAPLGSIEGAQARRPSRVLIAGIIIGVGFALVAVSIAVLRVRASDKSGVPRVTAQAPRASTPATPSETRSTEAPSTFIPSPSPMHPVPVTAPVQRSVGVRRSARPRLPSGGDREAIGSRTQTSPTPRASVPYEPHGL